MTPPAKPPSYLGSAVGFAFAGSGVGSVLGPWTARLVEPPPLGMSVVYTWLFRGIAAGVLAGFALGLTYAFLRRPVDRREPEE